MFRALLGAFDNAAAFVCCAFVTALLGCVSLGVVTRAMGEPLIWTDELSRFLMVWLAVFGWVVASRKRIHVRIRFFQGLLPKRGHKATELAIQAAMTLFGALITWYSVGLIGKNYDLEATSLPLSMAWMYAPMVLAGAITALQGATELIEALRRPRPPAAGEEVVVE
ncbi:MAG: TRAP transporter small permease [Pseudomonadota bacterium]|nr:TRAP transporter small permease [Pseudomonadota bacterium]